MFERWSDIIAGAFLLLVSIIFIASAAALPEAQVSSLDLTIMPIALGIVMLLLSLALLIQGLRKYRASTQPSDKPHSPRYKVLIISIVLMAFCGLCFESLGFIVTSTIYLFFQGWVLTDKGKFKPLSMGIFSVVAPVIVYYMFTTWFALSLPLGILRYFYA